MGDRERMIALIQEAVGGCARHWAALIADNLIKNGVGFIELHPIDDLNLSVRAYNCLKRAGIDTVEELNAMDEDSIMRIRGVGVAVCEEILAKRNGGTEDGNQETSLPAQL